MHKKIKLPVRRLFVFSVLTGLLISYAYEPLFIILGNLAKKFLKISPWEEIAVISLIGVVFVGVIIYYFAFIFLNFFTQRLLNYLVVELRQKEILPPKYKPEKGKNFLRLYQNIINIFDSFIEMYFTMKQDKDKFSKTMKKYMDPSLTKELHGREINEIYLGGKKKTATIFFSDLRGFTAMAEITKPELVIEILNDYFTTATKIIEKNRGSVNKYIGDAVMAVFEEAPKYMEYIDADKAIIAALDIQAQFQLLLRKWKEKIPELQIGLGIGLARGEVIAGNVGSEERMEYTVIGDTVNFASRLCGLAQDNQVIITDDIYRLVEQYIVAEALPPVTVKGKAGSHNIYSVATRKMLA